MSNCSQKIASITNVTPDPGQFFAQQLVQNKHGMLTSSVRHQNIAYLS